MMHITIKRFRAWVIVSLVLYHVLFAIFYGGNPFQLIEPDVWYSFGTGLNLVGMEHTGIQFFVEKEMTLPLFMGILYKSMGFPSFFYFLWIWNALTMGILIFSTFIIAKYYFDRNTAFIAALLIGLNWHVAAWGQELVDDVSMVSFMFLSIALYTLFLRGGDRRYLCASGVAAALAIWTKTSALYLFPPFILMLAVVNKTKIREALVFFVGFVLATLPFSLVCSLRYGHPLAPFVARVVQFQQAALPQEHVNTLFNTFYLEALPISVGLIVFPFLLAGLFYLIRKRKFLFPAWGLYCLGIYVFVIPFGPYDQYMVHFTPIFLIISAVGLIRVAEVIGRKGFPLIILALLSTNLSPPLGIRGVVEGLGYEGIPKILLSLRPLFLYPRQRWEGNKYVHISDLQDAVQNVALGFPSQSIYWPDWLPEFFVTHSEPDHSYTIIMIVILTLVCIYLIMNRGKIAHVCTKLFQC